MSGKVVIYGDALSQPARASWWLALLVNVPNFEFKLTQIGKREHQSEEYTKMYVARACFIQIQLGQPQNPESPCACREVFVLRRYQICIQATISCQFHFRNDRNHDKLHKNRQCGSEGEFVGIFHASKACEFSRAASKRSVVPWYFPRHPQPHRTLAPFRLGLCTAPPHPTQPAAAEKDRN